MIGELNSYVRECAKSVLELKADSDVRKMYELLFCELEEDKKYYNEKLLTRWLNGDCFLSLEMINKAMTQINLYYPSLDVDEYFIMLKQLKRQK